MNGDARLPEPLIAADEIARRVDAIAAQISADYADKGELVLIGVLKGAFIFLADLSRRLTIPRSVEFMALSSYGTAGTEGGAVRVIMDLRRPIEERHVLVVEDIVDTGRTLAHLIALLATRDPASIKTCALVRKKDRHEIDVPIDYLGFDIPDVWAVGYGLDYQEQFRTLPYIGTVSAASSPAPP